MGRAAVEAERPRVRALMDWRGVGVPRAAAGLAVARGMREVLAEDGGVRVDVLLDSGVRRALLAVFGWEKVYFARRDAAAGVVVASETAETGVGGRLEVP